MYSPNRLYMGIDGYTCLHPPVGGPKRQPARTLRAGLCSGWRRSNGGGCHSRQEYKWRARRRKRATPRVSWAPVCHTPGWWRHRQVRPWTGSGRRVAGANPSLIPLHPHCETRSGRRRPNRADGSDSARTPPALAGGAHSLSLSLSTSLGPIRPPCRSARRPGTLKLLASSPRCGRPARAGPRNARAASPSRYPGREPPAGSSPPR